MPLPAAVAPLLRDIMNGQSCLLVGSAFSHLAAGYSLAGPLSDKLKRLLPTDATYSISKGDLPKVAELFQICYSRRELLELLWQEFRIERTGLRMQENFLRFISAFDWQAIYTTNYDPLLEHTLSETPGERTLRVITQNSDLAELQPQEVPIIKLHGCINELAADDVRPLVIAASDYFEHRHSRNRELLFSRLRSDLARYTFLFVGFGMEDFFRRLWSSIFVAANNTYKNETHYEPQQHHYAVQHDATSLDRAFWRGYGVRVIKEDLALFVDRVFQYKDKMIAVNGKEYFPYLEKRTLTQLEKGLSERIEQPTTSRQTYQKMLWRLSQSIFSDRSLATTRRQLGTIARRSVYLSSVILHDLKIDHCYKVRLAKTLSKNLIASLESQSEETRELAVSALAWKWRYLSDTDHQNIVPRLLNLLSANDTLTIYKISQLPLQTRSSLLVSSFLDLLITQPGRGHGMPSMLTNHPLVRLIRHFMMPLATAPEDIGNPPLGERLLEAFETTTDPVITWELGVAIADRFSWEPDFRERLKERIESSIQHISTGTKYSYVIYRENQLRESLSSYAAGMYRDRIEILSSQSTSNQQHDLFTERFVLAITSNNMRTADDFLSMTERYPTEPRCLDPSRLFVMLSLPPLALRLPYKEAIHACSSSIQKFQDIPALAQPFFYIMCEVILKTIHSSELQPERDIIFPQALDIFQTSPSLKEDIWSRFMLVRLAALFLSSAPLSNSEATNRARQLLRRIADDENERITIRGTACAGVIP